MLLYITFSIIYVWQKTVLFFLQKSKLMVNYVMLLENHIHGLLTKTLLSLN